ncbi:MAG: SRPBCC family protein [Daejeonella sp.]|uniref:SRPBCC family protein n=1 Tax=Daejeonella sp. JGW-45 TaxID=3034148 RepID=UPI0023EB14AB|nr:SRPBCC domain-containing protein [Daejeonella sp. JGW-45]
MTKQLFVIKEKTIKASPEQVWEVITTPQYFNQWMFVPGQVAGNRKLRSGSKIQWINDEGSTYLEGEVIEFITEKKLVISLRDISWPPTVPEHSVTYEYHLEENKDGTAVKFHLGDLSVDPEAESWYNSYNSSDEIGEIEGLIRSGTLSG